MNARERALDYFCDELDEYLAAVMEEDECTYDEAVDVAMFEYDEFWKACLEQELETPKVYAWESFK